MGLLHAFRWTSLAIGCALVGAAALVRPHLEKERTALELNWVAEYDHGLPPELAITGAALGTFRGLAVNLLWYRAMTLRDDGRFHEAMQLSDWITRMQPRFPRVWEFHAWNMSYNITAATHTPEERWMWVDAGIRLLRDRGVPANPQSLRLHSELAWTFFHKIGEYDDDANGYYKRRLAAEWHAALGPPPGGTNGEAVRRMQAIATAPQEASVLKESFPELESVLGALEDSGIELDLAFLARATEQPPSGRKREEDPPELLRIDSVLAPLEVETRAALIAFARARWLRTKRHMDPAFMLRCVERFGPLDWRHPAAHSIYWTALGIERQRSTPSRVDGGDSTSVGADRMIFLALSRLAHEGWVLYAPEIDYYSALPDPRFIEPFENAIHTISERDGELDTDEFRARHQHFLDWAVRTAYTYGERAQAHALYTRVRRVYGRPKDPTDRYRQTLDEFVMQEVARTMTTPTAAKQVIAGYLFRAIVEGFANDNPELASGLLGQARRLHAEFLEKRVERDTSSTEVGLESVPRLFEGVLVQFFELPTNNVPVAFKARVWKRLPEDVRRRVDRMVRARLEEDARRSGMDPERAFPHAPNGAATDG